MTRDELRRRVQECLPRLLKTDGVPERLLDQIELNADMFKEVDWILCDRIPMELLLGYLGDYKRSDAKGLPSWQPDTDVAWKIWRKQTDTLGAPSVIMTRFLRKPRDKRMITKLSVDLNIDEERLTDAWIYTQNIIESLIHCPEVVESYIDSTEEPLQQAMLMAKFLRLLAGAAVPLTPSAMPSLPFGQLMAERAMVFMDRLLQQGERNLLYVFMGTLDVAKHPERYLIFIAHIARVTQMSSANAFWHAVYRALHDHGLHIAVSEESFISYMLRYQSEWLLYTRLFKVNSEIASPSLWQTTSKTQKAAVKKSVFASSNNIPCGYANRPIGDWTHFLDTDFYTNANKHKEMCAVAHALLCYLDLAAPPLELY